MQKCFLALALFAGLSGTAHAQRSIRSRSLISAGGVSLGIKGGATLSNFVGINTGNYEDLYGFHVGGFANINLSRSVLFQPELLYSQKGARTPAGTSDYVNRRLHYVDVPLALRLNAQGFFVEAGPQIGFLVLAQDKFGSSSATLDRRDFNTTDIGYLAGLGFQRKSGLGIGLRYNGTFNTLRPPVTIGGVLVTNRARNSFFQLSLMYSFNKQR